MRATPAPLSRRLEPPRSAYPFDNAQVTIDGNASLDASGATVMTATVTYPFVAPLDNARDFFSYLGQQFETDPLGSLSSLLGEALMLKPALVNSWASSADIDQHASISFAGSVDFQSRTTYATVDVNGGAQINQDTAYRSATQRVQLDATTTAQMISLTGIFDYDIGPEGIIKAVRSGPTEAFQPFGAQGTKAGFGGAYRQNYLDTHTHAIIHGADAGGKATAIHAAADGDNHFSLEVGAQNNLFSLAIAQAGASSGQFGISGTAIYNQQTTDTQAAITSGAIVQAQGLAVSAGDDSEMFSFAGDVVKGQNLGFGASLVYNDIDRGTQAYVGDLAGEATTASSIAAQRLNVIAETEGSYLGFALAGSQASNGATPAGGTHTTATPNPAVPINNGHPVNPTPASTGKYGLSVSGDVVYNDIYDATRAVIDDAGKLAVTDSLISATDDTIAAAGTGGAAIAKGGATSAGLAGSYSENRFNADTRAVVHRATLEVSDGLILEAVQTGSVTAAAAGGSGSFNHADGSADLAGSVAINGVTPAVLTAIQNASVTGPRGGVELESTDQLAMYALAGAASFGGKQGFGTAVATNTTHWTGPDGTTSGESVKAQITGSTIDQPDGQMIVSAKIADPDGLPDRIVAIAGSLGQGKTVGVSGVVAVNDLGVPSGNAVEASITSSSITRGSGTGASISLTASADQSIVTVGGEVAVASGKTGTFALGAGVAVTTSSLPVQAFVTGSPVDAQSLAITATIDGGTATTSAGAVGANDAAAAAGSAAANTNGDQALAYVDGLAAGQRIALASGATVTATNTMDLSAGAGNVAAGTQAVGAAVAINDLTGKTEAYIGTAEVDAGGTVALAATSGGTVTAVAAGVDAARKFALGGSVAITATDTTTAAYAQHATIRTPGSIGIAAQSALTFVTVAGALDLALKSGAAAGAASATLVRKDFTQAWATDGSLDWGGGVGQPLAVKTVAGGVLKDAPGYRGLSVTAVSGDDVTTASAGASATGGNAGIAGSATVTVLEKQTQAFLGNTLALPGTQGTGSINLVADDQTRVGSGAGAAGASKGVGVGAGVDTVSITKSTQARFQAQAQGLHVAGDIVIQALSTEDLMSVALGTGVAANLAIAGAASAYVLDLATFVAIDQASGNLPSSLTIDGSLAMAAQNDTAIDQFPGGLEGATSGSVGAALGVVDVKSKWVDAYVAQGTSITALADAQHAAIAAPTGTFEVGFTPPSGSGGDVQPPGITVDIGKQTGSSAPALANPNLVQERKADPVFTQIHGIAIGAVNTGVVKAATFAAGGAGTFAVDLDAAAQTIAMTTHVRIDAGADLASSGDVLLASGADLQKLGITGAAAGSASGSGAAGADVTLVNMDTGTYIYGNADGSTRITAGAAGSVVMNAHAQEDILAVVAGFAASGFAGLEATAAVVQVTGNTYAGVFGGAATIKAGGNVQIDASDDTAIAGIAGGAAFGITGGGFGGSTVVTIIEKRTNAIVTGGSKVDAAGNAGSTMTVLDGAVAPDDSTLTTKAIKGVAIHATSSEAVQAVAVGGAGGLYVGAGAGVTVTSIDSDTTAQLQGGAQVNQGGLGGTPMVSVTAGNVVSVVSEGGGVGIGGGGIGGGIDVGTLRNDTWATVGGDAVVTAPGGLDVLAPTLTDIRSFGVGVGAGLVGVAGSVSVWTLGMGVNSTYTDGARSDNALAYRGGSGGNTSVPASADTQTSRGDITGLMGAYASVDGANAAQTSSLFATAGADYTKAQPSGVVSQSFAATTTASTLAEIGQAASITADGVTVKAFDRLVTGQAVGTVNVGLGTVGGSVAVLNLGRQVTAQVDGEVYATGAIAVDAGRHASVISLATAGAATGIVGLGAEVAVVNDHGSVSAQVGDTAVLSRADQGIGVHASSELDPTVTAGGFSFSVGAAAGEAIAAVRQTGATTSASLASPSIGDASAPILGDITVQANALVNGSVTSSASAGGLVAAGLGNISTLDVEPTVTATVAATGPARLFTKGAVEVQAIQGLSGTAVAKGSILGGVLTAGTSKAVVTENAKVLATIGAENSVSAGKVTVAATGSEGVSAQATANGGYTLLGTVVGADAETNLATDIEAGIQGNVTAAGDIAVTAQRPVASADAQAHGNAGQGLVDVGISTADASSTSTVLAYVQGSATTTAGGDILIEASEGAADSSTGPSAFATASQGVYAAGTHLTAQAKVVSAPTVKAVIGDPSSPITTSGAKVQADGNLTLQAGSWTDATPQALNGSNAGFVSYGNADASVTYTKDTEAYLGNGVQVGANGQAAIAAQSAEDASPAAAGQAGGGLDALGAATTEVWLGRQTMVNIGYGATLDAGTIVLDAQSKVTGAGALPDNQGHGGFNSTFHAGDSLAGHAHPVSTFAIGLDASGAGTQGGTAIFIEGALTAPTISMAANTVYDFSVHSFGWVTAGAGTTYLTADVTVTTQDSTSIRFANAGSANASQHISFNSGFTGSHIDVLTALHYSEDVKPIQSDTSATVNLNGVASIADSDNGAVTAPSVATAADGSVARTTNWSLTVTDSNKGESWGNHGWNPDYNHISAGSSIPNKDTLASAATRIDPSTGWIIQGEDEDDDWLELTGDPAEFAGHRPLIQMAP